MGKQSKQLIATQNSTSDLQRLTNKTFSELVNEFLITKKSSQTQRAYRKDIETFFSAIKIFTVGELVTLPVHELSKLIINYIESFKRTEEHRIDRVHNPRTLNRKAYALSSFFQYLVANYGYPRNPVKVYTPYSTPDKTSTHDLTKGEVEAIWAHVRKQVDEANTPFQHLTSTQQMLIFGFLMLSLRRNEIAHLRRDDRDKQKRYMTVYGK
jgi:site-specific recombinase XerD